MNDLSAFTLSISGIEELPAFQGRGVSHVVSLIDPDEPRPQALDLIGHRSHLMVRLHDIIDEHELFRAPDREDVAGLIDYGRQLAQEPVDHLLVHCHMGRSRSTAAAAVLMHVMELGPPKALFDHIAAVRDPIWPNSRILAFADDLLQTGGALRAACRPIYQDMATRHRDWIEPFVHTKRARDLFGEDALVSDAGPGQVKD